MAVLVPRPARTTEGEAEEKKAAEVYARDVTELVASTGIAACENGHVVTPEKRGQGRGHESAMECSKPKAGYLFFMIEARNRPVIAPA